MFDFIINNKYKKPTNKWWDCQYSGGLEAL